jgi:geranylgeranyl diphosphate synthase type II
VSPRPRENEAIMVALSTPSPADDLASRWRFWRTKVDQELDRLVGAGQPDVLWRSMRYSVEAGGKRLRPLLTLATLEALRRDPFPALPAACAVELVHTFSLIHDDLPAMDNDDFRRGRPSNHRAFDEATALLAGDALHSLAFRILSNELADAYPASSCLACVRSLSDAAVHGLASGQVADIQAGGRPTTEEALLFIHERKTGALFRSAVEIGAILGDASPRQARELDLYASSIGLAFQIADDILDVIRSTGELGKSAGKDERDGKATYVRLFGVAGARERLHAAIDRATGALASWGPEAQTLRALAELVAQQVAARAADVRLRSPTGAV